MDILQLVIQFGPAVVKAMGYKNEDVDAAVESMTGGGIKGNSFLNSFTGGQGLTGLLKNQGKKFIGNQAFKALTGGSGSGIAGAVPFLGAALGLGYMTNPLREGSYNYNPYLQDQLNYVQNKNGYSMINPSSGLGQYGPESVLSGQNQVSMFGTNDYLGQLNNKLDYANKKGNSNLAKKVQKEIDSYQLAEVNKELAAETTTNNTPSGNGDGGGGSGTNNAQHGSSGMSKSQHSAFRAARGGIANVNMNRGQLGEQLRG